MINSIIVHLPNGSQVTCSYYGTVHFNDMLYLHNVLYLLEFSFNLISVTKLTKSLNCQLIFDDKHCFIQDINALRRIGTAKVSNGLYVLQESPVSNFAATPSPTLVNTFCKDKFDIWHFRLGHIPVDKIHAIQKKSSYVTCNSNKRDACDICHFSKQKKLSFPISESKSSHAFDLLHADIWGPISVPSIQGHKYFLTLVDDHTRHT